MKRQAVDPNPVIPMRPIGIVHTPFTELEGMPIQPPGAGGAGGTAEIYEAYAAGLADLDGFSHIVLLYHFHRSSGYDLEVVPFMDDQKRGVFATRAPRRPNPIGLSVVELERIEGRILHIRNPDVVDGTPLLDIKPYVPAFGAPTGVRTGWLEAARAKVDAMRADGRFGRRPS